MSWQELTPTKKGFFIGLIIGIILSSISIPIAMGCFDSLGHAPPKYEICRTPFGLIFTAPAIILYFVGWAIFYPINWLIFRIIDSTDFSIDFVDKFGFTIIGIETGIVYALVFGLIGMLIGYIIKKRRENKSRFN